jgi:nitrite reductase/ring-hydroxylating ferredoxin subunit
MSTDITHNVIPDGADAGRGRSVQDILTTDTRTVPSTLLHTSTVDMGSADIPTRRYTSADYHQREISHVWRRVWQMACREEDIPEPGDHLVYDIGDDSVIVVRGEDDQIRAFPNSCLHRGTALCEGPGNSAKFTCRFHGMQWDIDGTLNSMPSSWDFPHVNPAEFNLPAVRTGTWGGFVFVCFDPNTESLESYLEVLPEQFTAFPLENRHKAVQGHRLQLEGRSGGVFGGISHRRDPPADAAVLRRRTHPVRRLARGAPHLPGCFQRRHPEPATADAGLARRDRGRLQPRCPPVTNEQAAACR